MLKYSFLLLVLWGSAAAGESQRIAWGELVELLIPVGIEQEIATDPKTDIDVGVPAEIAAQLEVLVAAGRIFLTAKAAFKSQKIVLRTRNDSMLLDLTATPDTAPLDYLLTLPVPVAAAPQSPPVCQFSDVELVQWAFQTLYAPRRLVPPDSCFQQVPSLTGAIDLFSCHNTLLCGGGVLATSLMSWRTQQGDWIHALNIKNHLPNRIVLDPWDLAVHSGLYAASFSHTWMDAAGSDQDGTVLILLAKDKLDVVIPLSRWVGDV